MTDRMPSRWDGGVKSMTTSCATCPHHLTGDAALGVVRGDRRTLTLASTLAEVCDIGVAWKYLVPVSKPRKCALV